MSDMVQPRKAAGKAVNGAARSSAVSTDSKLNSSAHHVELLDQKTDYSRWRLLDEQGRHTWHYLTTDEQVKAWPQTIADKYHLGLPTVRYHALQRRTLANDPRACLSSHVSLNHPSQSTTVFHFIPSYNYHRVIGLASMVALFSSCPDWSLPGMSRTRPSYRHMRQK
jgi:hypothetical protein